MSKLYRALGLMSGTSLDGIDVALIETDGQSVVKRGPSATFHYSDPDRSQLQQALADAVEMTDRHQRPGRLAAVETALTFWHAEAVRRAKAQFDLGHIDLIGFHGQTVLHRPEKRLTVQLGDGQALANHIGIPVVFDMRSADVAAGGQGAPLVPIYHAALAASIALRPVAFVNIGGVGNVTWVGKDGSLVAFDTGPGNALIDDWMKRHTGIARDEGGAAALAGRVDESVVVQFLGDGYFERAAPKSLDRNSFAGIMLDGLSVQDGAATLVAVTARSIVLSRQHMPEAPKAWVICGGGRHNKAIMQALSSSLPNVSSADSHGFNGDSMEAEAWAYLAVRCLKGLPISFPRTTGVAQPMTGGVMVKPD